MKTKNWIKLAIVAMFISFIFVSCEKQDEILSSPDQPSWNVRPDFASIDYRPADVIARHQVTGDDTEPVKLLSSPLKAANKYALVIGISDYAGTANDLQYCDDDAVDWKNRLQAEGYNVTTLIDGPATKTAIENAVNNLASVSMAGNEIAFVYSGHGSKGNIISSDLYYISSTWFKTKFAAATSVKMMFSFDACQIGAMSTDLNSNGRVIAVASNKTSYSYDGDATMKNGVFTYYQMQGFDLLGYIYLEPDCKYACDEMIKWAKARKLRVVPSYVDSFTGDFDL